MSGDRVPATMDEAAFASDMLRAVVATLVTRKRGPLVLTEKARRISYGLLLRMVVDDQGTITAWVEPGPPDARVGVVYVSNPPFKTAPK